MADLDDDWMNPRRSHSYTISRHEDGTFYWIQRKRAIPVSGNVAEIYRWDMWSEFADEDERNRALEKLRVANPGWYLRARTVHYVNGEARVHDPYEYMDF